MLGDLGLVDLLIGIACIAGVYYLLVRIFPSPRPERPRDRFRPRIVKNWTQPRPHDPLDAADQLRAVMNARFSARKVMNGSEYRVFRIVESEVRTFGRGCRTFAQTALGELITSEDRRAHSAINSKRCDVIIIGPSGLPLVAFEYQGGAHYQKDAAARDAVKKEALRKAGVQYVEVLEHHSDDELAAMTRSALARAVSASPNPVDAKPAGPWVGASATTDT